jgi:CRISPR-associated protein Csx14
MSGFAVDVDLENPGQLFACCGLLEAADRLWRDRAFVAGHFDGNRFCIESPANISAVVEWLRQASVKNVQRKPLKRARGSNSALAEYDYSGSGDDPAVLCWPDGSEWRLNSWSGEDFGRTRIKTFAGQMKGPKVVAHLLDWMGSLEVDTPHLFDLGYEGNASVFGFDARKGRAALDVGFSQDALGISGEDFPAVELFAAIGLQGFRPKQVSQPKQDSDSLVFGVWTQPLPVELARAAAGCAFTPPGLRRFRFRLLGRKERSGVAGAPNDQYKAFTRAQEIFEREGKDTADD